MSDKHYVGLNMASFESMGEYEPISRVTLWADDERYYTSGDDTGRELSAPCRGATQEMVDNIYKRLKGFVYRPFRATGVDIDPAAEMGDAVTIGGIYSFIGQMNVHFGPMCDISIGAPGEKEVDHEVPYLDPVTRELKRRVKLGQSYFGTKITRKDGLAIEKLVNEAIAARVVLNAEKLAFYGPDNEEQLYFDPAQGCFTFRGAMNVNDNFIVDKLGNVTMAGSITLAGDINMADGIFHWGDNVPNKKRFATSTDGPWHDTMQSGDIYCCDWDYMSEQWGSPYKFVGIDGKDGRDGSDATVPAYITQTVISKGVIQAPTVIANEFKVTPGDAANHSGGFIIFAPTNSGNVEVFRIAYAGDGGGAPSVYVSSGDAAHVYWNVPMTHFSETVDFTGDVNFENANVKGVTATFG